MKSLRKLGSIILAVLLLLPVFTLPAMARDEARYTLPFDVNAESYILVSLDTGEIVFEKNMNEQLIPASLTKLMTAYVVMKYVDDLDNTMVTAPNYIYDELYGLNSSTADIRQKEVLSVRNLLYALLLPSANEAAGILADYVGEGNMQNFYMMMNSEAQKLGCTNTHFTNPHGLFIDDHYTSAYDMYLIAKACYETPGFMDIVTTTTYQLPANVKHANPYYIQSTVRMQNRSSPYYRSYIRGMKTGSLPEIGHNYVAMCEKNDERYIIVVIGASKSVDPQRAFVTTADIMDYYFANYSLRNANTSSYPVSEVPVKYSADADTVLLYADTEVNAILPNEADESSFQKVYHIPESIAAPVQKGQEIGSVDYYLAGRLIGTSVLTSHDDIERSTILFIVGKLSEMVHSLYFRTVMVVGALLIIAIAVSAYRSKKKAERMRKVHRR